MAVSTSITPDLLESRRQEALNIATECMKILLEEYQVKEVILFGSLAGDGPWHSQSDIDLAVVGLPDRSWWNAYDRLKKILPSWLTLDLVRLENVYPEIRSRILREKVMPTNKYLALKERLELELTALEKDLSKLETAYHRAGSTPDEYDIRALETYLVDFYKRCERISERVAVTLDENLPKGENWHELLLKQLSRPGGDNRPLLWDESLLKELDEYRKFRHIVHHKYGDELKAENVLILAQLAPTVKIKMQQSVAVFIDWLDERELIPQ